ncbi:ATPase domain-containing protein [Fimbriimonas ginsengisoli]|uniref:non-specific serine/threonine protein kinase n=1 Tax=Fimbriimonas ginsengisoli Gsoil 348 TaxID=661478 RepID=A0A068NW46_FIMGI|nr:ATPase domain-containing protein [Fimbriimonas ginsengisoli]AIE85834.1 putative circadian clock protein, KaiC [Fimbriimonas ginsengisoli Gsoil 348]
MNQQDKITINKLPTGISGLDEVLGGGVAEYSFNIIAGAPGCGKTTLAHQIIFANATPECPALYFTVLGEPAIKMLRYQQQFSFFDLEMVNRAVRFVNLSDLVIEKNLEAVLAEIVRQVQELNPSIVVVDSFRTVVRKAQVGGDELQLQSFVQRLAMHLTSWQATTFLIGEYSDSEIQDNPVFTVSDGLFWLYQSVERNSIVRKLQVMKCRGQETVPGLHTFRISGRGLQVFPRTFGLTAHPGTTKGARRLSTGVAELDRMMSGGIPSGHSMLVAGPSGSGKSILGTHFISQGLAEGEPGIVAVFEELPEEYAARAAKLGFDFDEGRKQAMLEILYLRPLDLSVDETVHEIVAAVKRTGAKRLVIDSLVGFEMALAPGFRTDFRESLYRMIGALTRLGVTIISTVEVEENFTSMGFSNFAISFLSDDILRLRYVSINGQLRRMLMVVKMRSGSHSIDMCEYEISSQGIVIGERLRGYQGLTTGVPGPWADAGERVAAPKEGSQCGDTSS